MGFTPTPEQATICDTARTEQNMIIEAGAGTGKTSTLRLLANDQPKDRCLYIAYNKAMQEAAEASFPPNVRCRTAHSLAYGGTIRRYGDRVAKSRRGSLPSRELLKQLNITQRFYLGAGIEPLQPKTLAEMTARALTRFTTTGDPEITARHVQRVVGLDKDVNDALAYLIAEYAQRAWDDYTNPRGTLTFTPNVYLKLWQLSNPRLRFDTVFFDEAQDANGAMAAVVNKQQCKRRAVGDRNQALYEWNGAVDAMAKWAKAGWTRLFLTQSFRFGPAIANEANKWLTYLDAELRLSGLPSIGSEIVDELPEPSAILCRTNMGVIDAALGKLAQGYRVAIPGGIGEAAELAKAAADLRAYGTTTHPDLAAFSSWEEFITFVRTDADGEDFRVLVSLVETYGTDQILSLKRDLVDGEAGADVVVTTGHKSKGKEWPSVLVAADFAPRESDPEAGDEPLFTRAQAMLAYVAITRGKFQVCPGPLRDVL